MNPNLIRLCITLSLIHFLAFACATGRPRCDDRSASAATGCQVTHTFRDGRSYVGGFRGKAFDGQGTVTHPSGNKYVGEFRDGKPNGQGTLTFADGGTLTGYFWGFWGNVKLSF